MYKKYRETKALKKEKSQNSFSRPPETKKPKPEWDFSVSDPDKYKLSQAEMIQRKYSYISKNHVAAKEQWLGLQEKLKKGVKDQETSKLMETALLAKNLIAKPNRRQTKTREKSVNFNSQKGNSNKIQTSQIIDDSQSITREIQPTNLLEKIEKNLENTRLFIKKMEKCKETTMKNPTKVLKTMEKILKDNEEELINEGNNIISKENNTEVAQYFKSLNKIEDTIRFLEGNFQENKAQSTETQRFSHAESKVLPEIATSHENDIKLPQISTFISPDNKTFSEKMQDFSTLNKELKTFMLSPDNFMSTISKSKEASPSKKPEILLESPLKSEHSRHSPIKSNENEENLPVSFDLTARSKDIEENFKESFFNSILKSSEIQLNPINPDAFFKNIERNNDDSDKENQDVNLKPKKVIFSEIEGQKLNTKNSMEEDEDDMLEKVKEMLENTKNELNKMNEKSFDFPNYQIIGKEKNNFGFFFEDSRKKPDDCKKTIQITPAVKTLKGDFQAKVNFNHKTKEKFLLNDDEDIPLPRNYNVIKTEEIKKNQAKIMGIADKDSLNLRSFLK